MKKLFPCLLFRVTPLSRRAQRLPKLQLSNSPFSRYRWTVCALLFFATTINYLDRQVLSLLKPLLDEQLHWTNAQFGEVNAAFQGAYAVGLLGFGWLIDRYGVKLGYALSIAAWSLAAAGHALAATIPGFRAARVCLGLGEGGNFPSAVKAVALWFPRRERAYATTLFNSGANVGAIVAPAAIPLLALHFGWQSAFLATGIAGLLWLAFWLPLYRSPGPGEGAEPEPPAAHIPWGTLLRYRQAWSFVAAKFLTDPVWWFFLIWLPDYFKKTRGLDLKSSWLHLVTIYTIVTVLSVLGGWATGRLAQRGWSVTRARKTVMFVCALCVLPIVAAAHTGPWGAVLLIGLAGAAHQAWSANLYTTVSDLFPKSTVASVTGLGSMAGCLGGMAFPVVTGMLLDRFQAHGDASGGYALLFAICAVAYVLAFGLNHLLAPRFEPVGER